MTAKAVTNDQIRIKPTAEQVDTYTRRECELRKRFLLGILDTNQVLDELQKVMEMTRGFIDCNILPETPSWADQKNPIVSHTPGGIIDQSKLTAANIFADVEDVLAGEEFMKRAQKPDSMNACAFDFYSRQENWKYLAHIPKDVEVIVFANTVFLGSDGDHCVRYLYRRGAEWHRGFNCVVDVFSRVCRVARLASGTEASVAQVS